ncbi:Rpn family recombination-promoting nuclease/putative transposase [Anaerovibrio sp.]|uniref:Rpn family recombination-promoting nuclease/putative transposase n=1 Tax=Anaerovibrio sp. TaxID=1872532 RepID=UPI00388ED7DF
MNTGMPAVLVELAFISNKDDEKLLSYPEEEKSIDVRLDSKSIRLDVYVNDDKGTVFNIEMQTTKDMEELVKRTRYYQAMIDIDLLEKGQDYEALNNTYIIFICTFEVFTGKRHKYTFRNMCAEDYGIELEDGTTKLFLSTKGEKDDVSMPLKNFLDYVDGHAPADELMKEIDTEVELSKSRDEWRREYMTLALEIEKEKKLSLEQGEIEGRVKSIKSLMKNMKLSAEAAMEAIGIPKEDFSKYITML